MDPNKPQTPNKPVVEFENTAKPQTSPQIQNSQVNQQVTPPLNDTASVFNALSALAKSKKREIVLPLLRKRAIVTQLLVGDDVALRTSIVSPDLYETEISKLVYNHLEFIEEGTKKPPFEQFLRELSLIDRQVAIWGILNSSYGVVGSDLEIKCPYCGNTFVDTITYDEIFQEDTITLWSESNDFLHDRYEVVEPVNIENIKEIIFVLRIPVVQDRISLMNLLGLDIVKENFQQLGTAFTDRDNLTLITAKLCVNVNGVIHELTHMQDIHMAYSSYIPHYLAKEALNKYNEKYGKYVPNFRKPYVCAKETCKKEFDYVVDPEISLYQAFFE